jgi:hypothetical protein
MRGAISLGLLPLIHDASQNNAMFPFPMLTLVAAAKVKILWGARGAKTGPRLYLFVPFMPSPSHAKSQSKFYEV